MQNRKHLAHPSYRADIDGLRALAVLSVVVFHAFPDAMPGGFIGVDIFFVISGFLISTILLENLRKGTFSFAEFYSRRIRRIFPALLVVLSASYAFGWFALLPDEFMQLGKHIAAGAGFVSNFLLWSESGYFDSAAELKPLLHLWSLGIEEQFYIVWPLLLWAVARLRLNALTVILVVASISFMLNIDSVRNSPIAAFYSPQTRFWELLTGAIVAVGFIRKETFSGWIDHLQLWIARILFDHPTRISPEVMRAGASLIGLAAIVAGFWAINPTRSFPGYWALLPTLGAALLISAGPNAWLNRNILSARLLVWFGLISYPLYLWHWPLLSFLKIVEGQTPSIGVRIAAVGTAILLAWLTYRLVEKPIRFGPKGRRATVALTLLMLALGFLGYNTYVRDGLEFRSKVFQQNKGQVKYQESFYENDICRQLHADFQGFYCFVTSAGRPAIQILGDSHANRLVMGLARSTDEIILQIGHHGCPPFIDIAVLDPGLPKDECAKSTRYAIDVAANTDSIRTVIMTFAGAKYIGAGRYFEILDAGQARTASTNDILANAMRATFDLLRAKGKTILFVYDNPEISFDPNTCIDGGRPLRLIRREVRNPCGIHKGDFLKSQQEYRSLVQSVLKDYPDIRVVDAADALCDNDLCYAVKDGAVLYRDGNHLSFGGSLLVGREIAKALK